MCWAKRMGDGEVDTVPGSSENGALRIFLQMGYICMNDYHDGGGA